MKKRLLLKDHPKKRPALLFTALVVFSLLSLLGGNLLPALAQGPGLTSRVSVASDGAQGNDHSYSPSLSADGRYVAFHSAASNLVSGDTNGTYDVFVRDRQRGTTSRVSIASDGAQGNDSSLHPSLSADGRYVAFSSRASNLVSGDTNGAMDVFIHDRQIGVTSRVSVATGGAQANGGSSSSSVWLDGRYVMFKSEASNLVSGDTNSVVDIFIHDRQTGETSRVSVATGGAQANGHSWSPCLSADGRYAAFYSYASNLVSGDTNGVSDIFIHDRQTGETGRVSVATGGAQANNDSWSKCPCLSADGRYVTFHSIATNLVSGDTNGRRDSFIHDRQTGETSRISVGTGGAQGNSDSGYPYISPDGRYVTFWSYANNLVGGDTNNVADIFIHDRQTGETGRVSVGTGGIQANGESYPDTPFTADGRYVLFESEASNLVSGDTNGKRDIFIHLRDWAPTDQVFLPVILK